MKYLVIDGYLNGTGIRDKYEGYIPLSELNLSAALSERIELWLQKYWNEFYANYPKKDKVANLDAEGVEITRAVSRELPEDYKLEYFSDARMQYIPWKTQNGNKIGTRDL